MSSVILNKFQWEQRYVLVRTDGPSDTPSYTEKRGRIPKSVSAFERLGNLLFRRYIHSMNRASLNYSLAVNHFADQTMSEIKLRLGLKKTPGYHGGKTYQRPLKASSAQGALPDDWDWRIEGAVTQVGMGMESCSLIN